MNLRQIFASYQELEAILGYESYDHQRKFLYHWIAF